MRVVLDTNVLVSGFTSQQGTPAQLLFLWLAEAYDLALSEHIITETERVFSEPYFSDRLTVAEQQANLSLLRQRAEIIEITADVHGVAPSPADDLVLATAVAAQADCLVTGDRRFRAVDRYEGVMVVTPREFLELMKV